MSTLYLFIVMVGSLATVYLILWNRRRIIAGAKKYNVIKETSNENKTIKTTKEKLISKEETTEKKEPAIASAEIKAALRRAEILIEHQETEEAEKILVSILATHDKHLDSLILLSSLYLQKKQYSRAEVLYRELIKLQHQKDASTLSNLAFCLFEQNQLEDAAHFYKKALELDTKNVKRYTNLGQVRFITKQFDKAIELFRTATKMAPRDTGILFMLADTYREAQKYQEAKEYYNKILNYEPYNAEARAEIAKIEEAFK